MLSLPEYSVGFTIFESKDPHYCKAFTTQMKKTSKYHTSQDCFKNQEEKLVHFTPYKQDIIQLVKRYQKMFFDIYRLRI